MNITLRPVEPDDREFLLAVYEASREIELSMLPWDAAQRRIFVVHQYDAQCDFYEKEYRDVRHDVIICDGEAVGRLFVSRGDPGDIGLLDIVVLPEHRNKGIGTLLINGLKDEADASHRSLTVYVETFNPSQKLFRTLGFVVAEATEMTLRFEWRRADADTNSR